jgi:hypothetical protein
MGVGRAKQEAPARSPNPTGASDGGPALAFRREGAGPNQRGGDTPRWLGPQTLPRSGGSKKKKPGSGKTGLPVDERSFGNGRGKRSKCRAVSQTASQRAGFHLVQ